MIYSVCMCMCVRVHVHQYTCVHMCIKDPPELQLQVSLSCPMQVLGTTHQSFWLKEEHNKSILLCEPVGNQDCIVGNYIDAERLNSLTPLKCCEPWYSGKLAFGHWPLEVNVWMSPWSCYFSQSKESWQSVSTQRQRVLS